MAGDSAYFLIMTGKNIRECFAIVLIIIAVIALIVAKILWAITFWYDLIAVGIAVACLGLAKFLLPDPPSAPSNRPTEPGPDHDPDHRNAES